MWCSALPILPGKRGKRCPAGEPFGAIPLRAPDLRPKVTAFVPFNSGMLWFGATIGPLIDGTDGGVGECLECDIKGGE